MALEPASHSHAAAAPWGERLSEVLTLQSGFNTTLVIIGASMLGLSAGLVGSFALMRKRSLMADALSHATLPGIVAAFLLAGTLGIAGRSMPLLLLGATISGVVGVVCVQAIVRYTRLREDAAIGLVLSVFFGVGVVGLSFIQANAPEGSAGLHRFIFGQAAAMQPLDIAVMAGVAVVAIVSTLLFFKEFTLVCFDEAFAGVAGWPISRLDTGIMALVVLVTVAGLQAVGLVLVVAMLIIPPVAARLWTDRLGRLVPLAGTFGLLSGYGGAVLSAMFPDRPAGAVMVLAAGTIFGVSLLVAPLRGAVAVGYRRWRSRLKIACDHLLEAAHVAESSRAAGRDLAALSHARGWSPFVRAAVLFSLRSRGFVHIDDARTLALSRAGRARGARVARNHALWEQYLIRYADVAPTHVDWSVDQVEHVLDETLVAELEAALAQPSRTGDSKRGRVSG